MLCKIRNDIRLQVRHEEKKPLRNCTSLEASTIPRLVPACEKEDSQIVAVYFEVLVIDRFCLMAASLLGSSRLY